MLIAVFSWADGEIRYRAPLAVERLRVQKGLCEQSRESPAQSILSLVRFINPLFIASEYDLCRTIKLP